MGHGPGRVGVLLATLLLGACATLSPEAGHREVAALVEERTGHRTHWEQGVPEDAQVAERVEALLREGLTRERAIEIALVNNPSLQTTYEELGVSQADMVQAGLLRNPVLAGSLGWPVGPLGGVEYEVSLVQEFLSLFVLPLRRRIAGEQFIADTLRVAHEALRVAAEVSQAFTETQAAERTLELQRLMVESAGAGAELAERLFEAGNIQALALASEQAFFQRLRVELTRDELHLMEARERLNRLLGLWGPQTRWTLAQPLQGVPPEEPALEQLEARALRQRLDVDAARKQAALMTQAVALTRTTRLFGLVEVGVHVHQDPNGPRLIGPTLALELPVFDQRQALLARLEAQRRQAERRLRGLTVDVRSMVRVARTRLLTARALVEHYRTRLLPLRERVLEQSQLQYNAMQLGLFQLLEARRDQVAAYREYLGAVRDYWVARAELERILGGRIGPPPPTTPLAEPGLGVPPETDAPHGEHHEHPAP
jgi:outer membrane protein, heavy metal efflux system